MTTPYEAPGEFKADNGARLLYSKREDGGVQLSILNERDILLAGWSLTPAQVIELFHELDFCEECGEVVTAESSHGPGRCSNPDDPGGLGD